MNEIARRLHAARLTLGALLAALLIGGFGAPAGATPIELPNWADPKFREVWERYDRPVYYGEASRSYTWGGQVSEGRLEPYKEGPSGQHLVQYFDKSRMEINNPDGDKNSAFFVTQGLLARDMIRGEVQAGDTLFLPALQGPAQIPFGDLDDTLPSSPTYATFRKVLEADPVPSGQPIRATIDRAGNVSNGADPQGVTSAGVIPGTPAEAPGFNQHAIASVFLTFIQQAGPVYENGQNVTTSLYPQIQYVFGFPITEAYWSRVKAGGVEKTVLIQCFERRCLTYTPSNDPAFRVELANTGLQYFNWRYPRLPNDQTAPKLSALKVESTTATIATISWQTDEKATTEIRYGTTDSYDKFQGDTTLVTEHRVTLTGLLPNQNYHFQIASADAADNRAESRDNVFKTKPETRAPAVSNVTVSTTATGATIAFKTDQDATAQVIYYKTADPTMKTLVEVGGAAKQDHSVTLSNLASATEYTYQIVVSSASGQTTTDPATFTTAAP